jgi:trigger factor
MATQGARYRGAPVPQNVTTNTTELGESRVRLDVEVAPPAIERELERAAEAVARDMKIPGFRKGKVPRQVLLTRIGREKVMAEAVETHIGGWYRNAVASSRVLPITQPEYDFELPTSGDETFTFTATVAVQPKPEPADWTELEVPFIEAEVPEEVVDQELEMLRRSIARPEPVEGRPAREGDVLIVDLVGTTEAQRDYVVELGAGRLVEELEHALLGMSAGESKEVEYEIGEDRHQLVEVVAKEIQEKVLPPPDDELARAASEFDTLAELRADIERTLHEQIEDELETQFRAAAVDTLVVASKVEPAGPLVEARARELLTATLRSFERRGISPDTYLALTNQTAEQFQERIFLQAAQAVARELVLEAVADKVGLQVSDDEVRALIREQAEAAGEDDPEAVTQEIFEGPARERLRDDLRMRSALDRVAAEVKRIPAELARAREKLWTPGQEKGVADTKLWTPATTKEPA